MLRATGLSGMPDGFIFAAVGENLVARRLLSIQNQGRVVGHLLLRRLLGLFAVAVTGVIILRVVFVVSLEEADEFVEETGSLSSIRKERTL